jgi:tetratricopeptide (TPR) repeat protein
MTNNYKEAIEYLSKVSGFEFYAGIAAYVLGKNDLALSYMENCTNCNDEAYFIRAKLHFSKSLFVSALRDCNSIKQTDVINPGDTYILRAKSEYGLNMKMEALRELKMALDFKPSLKDEANELLAQIGNSLSNDEAKLELKNYIKQQDSIESKESLELFDNLIKDQPESAEFYLNRCRDYLLLKLSKKSLEDLDNAIEKGGIDNGEAYSLRAQAKYESGNIKGSFDDVSTALRIMALIIH